MIPSYVTDVILSHSSNMDFAFLLLFVSFFDGGLIRGFKYSQKK
jgi:hypothetical protein